MLTAAVSLGAVAVSGYGHRAPAPRPAAAAPAKAHKATPAPRKSTTSPSRLAPQPTKTIVVTPPPRVIIQNPPAQPASALRYVGNGIYAGADTSDAFAMNVVAAWAGTPGVQYVYSPVTGQIYAMTYQVVGAGTVIATGGNGAYVQF